MYKEYIYFHIPTKEEINEAHKRIKPFIHQTPILHSERLNKMAGAQLFFKCENFQKAGAFKSRGASNAILSLNKMEQSFGVCTHSSGNHAQALARAAALLGIQSHIVMPDNAPQVKIDAVKEYGGKIRFCKPILKEREATLRQVQDETKAIEIHPYDNLKVIEGQATAAKEIYEETENIDFIIAPVGGGGLLSGTALASSYFSPKTKVLAAEPQGANDAYQSFNSKKFVPSQNPETMADGLLTSLGKYTFPIVLKYVDDILLVSEKEIVEAMKLIYQNLKIVIEPSSAVVLAAILRNKKRFEGKRIALILSGGNIDLQYLTKIFAS